MPPKKPTSADAEPTPVVIVNTGLLGNLMEIAKTWGIFAALVIVFVWQGQVREKELNDRMDLQRSFIEGKLLDTIKSNTTVIQSATIALNAIASQAKANTVKVEELEKKVDGESQPNN
jgi:hypothetical protein